MFLSFSYLSILESFSAANIHKKNESTGILKEKRERMNDFTDFFVLLHGKHKNY